MTDISNWADMVHIMQIPCKNLFTGQEDGSLIKKIMIPINEYQMGNLIDAISQVPDNGDWYGEFCDIVARAMHVTGIKELRSNRGNVYTFDEISTRQIRK